MTKSVPGLCSTLTLELLTAKLMSATSQGELRVPGGLRPRERQSLVGIRLRLTPRLPWIQGRHRHAFWMGPARLYQAQARRESLPRVTQSIPRPRLCCDMIWGVFSLKGPTSS